MHQFPLLSPQLREMRLQTPDTFPVRYVLDTDTFNEIDDQFAVTYSLLCPDKLSVEKLYAAPFHNELSDGPGDGMEKSYAEIKRLLHRLGKCSEELALRGSTRWLSDGQPVASEAACDLVERGMSASSIQPLYVAAIGAPTNIASALLMEPRLVEKIVVIWLGGHPLHWPHNAEFNLRQDVLASQILFASGVPLVWIPCAGVAEQLRTTLAEVDRYVRPCGEIGQYLAATYQSCHDEHTGYSRVIWDLSAPAWLTLSQSSHSQSKGGIGAIESDIISAPILNDDLSWTRTSGRHLIRCAWHVRRDDIFSDLFRRLAQNK